jgi:hypothetical protein
MASALGNPIDASFGATLGAASGSLSGAVWGASQVAKFGRYLAGTPGEISGAALGAGTGAIVGATVGAAIGALSGGQLMLNYLGEGELARLGGAAIGIANAPLNVLIGDGQRRGAVPLDEVPVGGPPGGTVPPAPSPFPIL